MHLSIIQFLPILGNINKNIEKIRELTDKIKKTDLIVLPELASTGYKFKDWDEAILLSERVENSRYLEFLSELAVKKNCYIVSGFNEREKEKLYNSSVLLGPEGIDTVFTANCTFLGMKKRFFEPVQSGYCRVLQILL